VDEVMNFPGGLLGKAGSAFVKSEERLDITDIHGYFPDSCSSYSWRRATLPQIESVFTELGAELPALTRAIVAFGKFLTNWWWAADAGLAILAFVFMD
jgi:hypothetical protein